MATKIEVNQRTSKFWRDKNTGTHPNATTKNLHMYVSCPPRNGWVLSVNTSKES
ncbi:hypothetical protein F441_11334 [Phytophthora nicotianae CJ01A1]|uniref:Uncharacterized protein n=2 Tax=Phytophthora nicotianae TaxID=4792 RepID=W2ISU6_PHYNI|nr:hypothetical protein L915_11106 [Phytophthora nicotianae]ETL37220.1 hypothetical protein L916_11004 [Phytophthora nicotianae]ETL90452.1 hypothetical protein L917_10914 [Phytophthora nicotianae]ETP13644.1 hypothetical protein F441_11334 [Phytophthora nicotianae CJ01A1]